MQPSASSLSGAAGRDFHNFNVAYRDDPTTEVVAFTAALNTLALATGVIQRSWPDLAIQMVSQFFQR